MEQEKRYYAMCSPYGVQTLSDCDEAYSFPTEEERDAWVRNEPDPFNPTRSICDPQDLIRRKIRAHRIEDIRK